MRGLAISIIKLNGIIRKGYITIYVYGLFLSSQSKRK